MKVFAVAAGGGRLAATGDTKERGCRAFEGVEKKEKQQQQQDGAPLSPCVPYYMMFLVI